MKPTLLLLVLVLLTACNSPIAITPTNIPINTPTMIPTATSTPAPDYSHFSPADETSWPPDLRAATETRFDQTAKTAEQLAALDKTIHQGVMQGLLTYLKTQTYTHPDLSAFTPTTEWNLKNSSDLLHQAGLWQKAHFEKTGQVVLLPADVTALALMEASNPSLMPEWKINKANGSSGVATSKIDFFGEPITRSTIMMGQTLGTVDALVANPYDQKTVIVIIRYPSGGSRPFLVNLEKDKVIDPAKQITFQHGGYVGLPDGIATIEEVNKLRQKVGQGLDLSKVTLVARATDGSANVDNTSTLTNARLAQVIGTDVWAYLYDRLGIPGDKTILGNTAVGFNSLFDTTGNMPTGLEELSGITLATGKDLP